MLLPLAGVAQKYTLSGKIQFTSFSQGGVEHIEPLIPYPMGNYQINIVQFNLSDSIPKIVKKIKTDSAGRFQVKLPPGEYGFAAIGDSLFANQYLPNYWENMGSHIIQSSSWTAEQGMKSHLLGPFIIKDKDFEDLIITNNRSSVCITCP